MLGPSRATAEEAALLAATEVVRGLLAETARGEVLGRHKAGTFLREVKGAPGAYGERCIERIGAELGISAATLYRYVAVAEIWSTGEIQAENTKIDKFGHPLSWSHFVALSQIPDRDIRQRLLAESLKHGWSARDLKIHIAGASQPRPSTEPVDPVEVALREGIHRATQATVDLTIFGEAFADRLQSSATHVHGELVTRAIDAFASLLIRTELTLAQLSHASGASDARVRVAPAVDVARRREHEEQQGEDSSGARPSSGRRIRLG